MNQKLIALADAIAAAFKRIITDNPKNDKEALTIPVRFDDHQIPNPRTHKKEWNEIKDALKFRHTLEMFYVPKTRSTPDEVIVCAYGWLSAAPMLTDAEVDKAIRDFEIAENEATKLVDSLMKRLRNIENEGDADEEVEVAHDASYVITDATEVVKLLIERNMVLHKATHTRHSCEITVVGELEVEHECPSVVFDGLVRAMKQDEAVAAKLRCNWLLEPGCAAALCIFADTNTEAAKYVVDPPPESEEDGDEDEDEDE